jgi:hypothetical protein
MAGAVVGGLAACLLIYREVSLVDVARLLPWSEVVAGGIAGALLSHVGRLASKRRLVSRAGRLAVLANAIVWTAFLIVTPSLDPSEFARIDADRETKSGFDFIHDAPTVVAARWHGTYGAVNAADMLLSFAAAPAIAFAQLLVVPPPQVGAAATRGESFVIALLAFVLSTAFWFVAGAWVEVLIRRLHTGKPAR